MKKLLTVVVPAYQVENYIEKNVESLTQTSYRELLDIIIVDDGSADGTGRLADGLAEKNPDCVRVIHQPNGGHGGAINTGIKEAAGRYFKVVDGDDWVDAGEFHKFLSCLSEAKEDIVFSDYTEVYENSIKEKIFKIPLEPSVKLGIEAMKLDIFLPMHGITYKTNILRMLPREIDRHCFYVDMEYILFPLLFVKSIRYEPYNVYRYRLEREGQSVSPEGFRKHVKDHEKVLFTLIDYYESHVRKDDCLKDSHEDGADIRNEENRILSYYMPQRISDLMLRHYLKCCWFLTPDGHIWDKQEKKVSISAYLSGIDKKVKEHSPFLYHFYKQIESRKGSLSNLQLRLLRATGFRLWPLVRWKKKITEK